MGFTAVTDEPISVADHLAGVCVPAAGAVSIFVGQVRDHDPSVSGPVSALEYTAHPDAADVLARIASAAASCPGVLGVAATHRVGLLEVGEVAIVVAVSTSHRSLAFEVCAELVETIKRDLPVWKRELLVDGGHHWVGLE